MVFFNGVFSRGSSRGWFCWVLTKKGLLGIIVFLGFLNVFEQIQVVLALKIPRLMIFLRGLIQVF